MSRGTSREDVAQGANASARACEKQDSYVVNLDPLCFSGDDGKNY